MSCKNKTRLISLLSIIVLVGIDQLIKYFVDLYLKPVGTKMLIPGFLQLHYLENDGAMMGSMGGKTLLMTIASVICVVVIAAVIFSGKLRFGVEYCCIVLMAAGGFGNIIDRIFRGYVIDYIEALFVDFYIFNFADCLVTCAAFTVLFYEIYQIVKDSKNKKEKATDG